MIDVIKTEVRELVRVLTEQEWRGIEVKGSLYYKTDEFKLLVNNLCPTICSQFGKYEVMPAIRLILMMNNVMIESCKFTHEFRQHRGYKVLLPILSK